MQEVLLYEVIGQELLKNIEIIYLNKVIAQEVLKNEELRAVAQEVQLWV